MTPWLVAQPIAQQKIGVNEVYPILEHCVITVRQLFEQSSDGGATWTPTFDGRYVRRR